MKAHRDYYKAFKKEEGAERQPISTLKFQDTVACVEDEGEFKPRNYKYYKGLLVVDWLSSIYELIYNNLCLLYFVRTDRRDFPAHRAGDGRDRLRPAGPRPTGPSVSLRLHLFQQGQEAESEQAEKGCQPSPETVPGAGDQDTQERQHPLIRVGS